MMRRRKYVCFLIVPFIILGLALIVMLLWNAILPDLLHLNSISFWQALGLLILCKILFGGFHGSRKRKCVPRGSFREKYRSMNEEEKQKFKDEWKNRCHWHRGS